MKRFPVLLLSLLAPLLLSVQGAVIPLPEGAASRIVTPQVIVAPDRTDWTYAPGDPVTFSIEVRADGQLVPGAEIEYRIGPEQFEGETVRISLPTGRMTIGGETMETPGFLRCEVTSTIHERTYKGMATVAFAPEKIAPTQVNPADFDTFWEAQLALLKDVPLGLKKTLLPDLCTPAVNVYAVRYMSRNHWREVPFYGILTEPVQPGTYPAVLRVPGAGVRPYRGQIGLSEQGIIALEIGIHGIPVTYYDSSLYE
jgi:cephalosporin-C deacetylase